MDFDCIVIGKGLIGSAAAKYLSTAGERVAVIGPDEPLDMREGIVFSSHYDQARIQRIIGTDATWTLLNQQSAAEYPFLQKESNINFHTPVGCLYVNPQGTDLYLEQAEQLGKKFNSNHDFFENGESLKKSFPDFDFPEISNGILEHAPSGSINPRLLIKAQLRVLSKNNGTIINEIAEEIIYENESIKVITTIGHIFKSKKVLVAAGAFTNSFSLLDKKLDFKLKSETTIWVKLNSKEAMRLSKLPSLLYEIDTPEIKNIYLVQPVEYPDGNYYLKMGANIPEDNYFENLEDIQNWFRTADNNGNLKILQQALLKLLPRINVEEFTTKKCIVTRTPHGKPYVGAVNDTGLFVAAGGNGYGAMCSDALGKIASHLLVQNTFPKEYHEKDFLPVYLTPTPLHPSTRSGLRGTNY
ncbi:MAG TPA: FAD-binding oxidoreductase [Chitinophagaceae bacterium]|nr:FAD-binding oxidoreductase [Chitinophagaceae bacterium]